VVDRVWCCQDWSFVAIAARYKGYRYPIEVIGHAVWRYHRFTLSLRDRRGADARPRRRGHLRDDPVLVCHVRAGLRRPVTSLATPPRRQMAPRRGFREDQRHHSLSVTRGRPARRRARHLGAVAPSRGGGYTVFPQAAQGPALRAARAGDRQAGQLSGRSPRGFAVGDPSPLEVPQQSGRELPSADQNPGTGDETLRLPWAGPTVPVCVQPHPTALSSPSSSDQRTPMANRDDQPLRGLGWITVAAAA